MLLARVSDLHLRPKGLAAGRVAETNMMTERALRAVGRMRPAADAVILSGGFAGPGRTLDGNRGEIEFSVSAVISSS